ncbi:hypothetical protein [Streptomyces sviceus]|uniref:hypothetical protein n=1 Tax=Streptomyces sviceus TaxID=285530 RepID=UPI0036EA9A10
MSLRYRVFAAEDEVGDDVADVDVFSAVADGVAVSVAAGVTVSVAVTVRGSPEGPSVELQAGTKRIRATATQANALTILAPTEEVREFIGPPVPVKLLQLVVRRCRSAVGVHMPPRA